MPPKQHTGITEQSKSSRHRRDDAQVLLRAARWRGAMYLAGYAVECLLKARLMKRHDCQNLEELEQELQSRKRVPEHSTLFTHHLQFLLRLTGTAERLRQDKTRWQTFVTVNRWLPAWRYDANPASREEAQEFMDAIDEILHWIEHNV